MSTASPATNERNLASLLDGDGFVSVEGDLCTLDRAAMVSKVDVMFHEAAQPGVRSSWERDVSAHCRNGIVATKRVLEVARQYAIRRFIYSSSSGITKLAGEYLCGSCSRRSGCLAWILHGFWASTTA